MGLLLILSVCLFTNCNSDADSDQTETLNGVWNLKNVRGGLQGINIDYSLGDVVWNFDLENTTLVVENTIVTTGPEDVYAGLDSGTYNIQIVQNNETEILFIDDVERGVIVLMNGTTLKIDDDLAADGFTTEFER